MKTEELTLTQVKQIRGYCDDLNIDDWKEVVKNIAEDENDFEVDNFRFIAADAIDEIQQDELKSDEYILGCFNAWFIADNCNIPLRAVEALQKAEAYQELGEMMIENGIEELQDEYQRLDGYGHHFNHYDGNTHEIFINGVDYYAFRIN